MKKQHELDVEDSEFTSAWFDHIYAWNRLLDSAGYVDYDFMHIEEKRVRTYAALLMLANNQWTTAKDVGLASELGGQGSMDDVLIGLSYMREVSVDMADNGAMLYQLTDFGKAWANALLLEHETDV